jgi:hypothetical protein
VPQPQAHTSTALGSQGWGGAWAVLILPPPHLPYCLNLLKGTSENWGLGDHRMKQ